jgi:hypothetical protein
MSEGEEPKFKVKDRRRFEADGTTKDEVEETPNQGSAPEEEPGVLDFTAFVASIATNAIAGMGDLPGAEAQDLPKNLDLAKQYIDILAMLQDKTRGNLTQDEEQGLQQILTQLRMRFVEVSKS